MLEIVEDELAPGRIVGAYRLDRVIGEGGMGVVWAAREISSHRPVALKFLRAGRASDPKNQERLLREARAAMAVSHPNVAKVEAVLETDAGVPFIVMELLEGESLRDVLRRRGALGVAECARIFVPTIDAVAAAHARGIVHRDLKPENVLLVAGDEVRVLDFGIAKQIPKDDETAPPSLTSTGGFLGTPFYMAPEQVYGDEDVDGRADVWALGVMIYECLAGKRPTDGAGFGPVLKRITTEPFVPLGEARPALPREIAAIVDAMLARDRSARPSLAEVRAALARASIQADAPAAGVLEPTDGPPLLLMPPSTTAAVASRRSPADPPATTVTGRSRTAIYALVVVGVLGAAFGAGRLGRGASEGPATAASATAVEPTTSAVPPPPTQPVDTASATAPAPSFAVVAPPTGAATGAPADAGSNGLTAGELAGRASAALHHRDGAACIRDLDAHDRLDPNPQESSREPGSPWAIVRASCMMLNGDCDGGKALYKKWIRAHDPNQADATIDASVEVVAASTCEGRMSARDELLRANQRLSLAATGVRKATVAECNQWIDTETRLAKAVKPSGPDDRAILGLPPTLPQRASQCLANAGDCDAAWRVFRQTWARAFPRPAGVDAQTWESTARATYDGMMNTTPCRGKP